MIIEDLSIYPICHKFILVVFFTCDHLEYETAFLQMIYYKWDITKKFHF